MSVDLVGVIIAAVPGIIVALVGPNGLVAYLKGSQAGQGHDGRIWLAAWGGLFCFVLAAVLVLAALLSAKHMTPSTAGSFRFGFTVLVGVIALPVLPNLLDSSRPPDHRVYGGSGLILAIFACAAVIAA
jgi:FtsH-binding integral membrane protein